jgi:hypothetical protein
VSVPQWQETIPLLPLKEKPSEKPREDEELLSLLASLKGRLQAFDGQLGGAVSLGKDKTQEIKTFLKNTEDNLSRLMK